MIWRQKCLLHFMSLCFLLPLYFWPVNSLLCYTFWVFHFFKIPTKFSYAQWENWREAVVYAWEVFIRNGSESDTALLSRLPTAKSSSVALAKSSRLVSSLAWCAGQYWAQLRVVGKPFLEQALRPKAACSTLDSKFPYFFVVAIAYTADCVSGPPHNRLFYFLFS